MAIPVSAGLAAAIEAPERVPLVRVAVDWDVDGFGPPGSLDDLSGRTGALTVTRTLTTDLPDPVRLVEGSTAATAGIDLTEGDPTDETMHPARYYTRGTDSPIGGKERQGRPITVDVGFVTAGGPQYVRRFTGRTRGMKTVSRGRSAALTALDNRALLRNTVTLIPTDGTQSGADGTWIVTQALAANGIYAGPAPRDHGLLLWNPMYGSLLPIRPDRDASWFANFFVAGSATVRPTFVPGPYVLAAAASVDAGALFIVTTPMSTTWDGFRGRLEMWCYGGPIPSAAPVGATTQRTDLVVNCSTGLSSSPSMRCGLDRNGHPFMKISDFIESVTLHLNTSALTVPADGVWHAVGVHWDHRAQTVTFLVDGQVETQSTGILVSEVAARPLQLVLTSYAPVSDILIHDIAVTEAWLAGNVVPTAFLDRSTLQLQACYESAPREGFDLITEVAKAEQAVAVFDEAGAFRYQTRARLTTVAGQTVSRVLTTADVSLLDVSIDDGIDQVRNIIQVGYDPVYVSPQFDLVYSDSVKRVLPPFTTVDFPLSFSDPVVTLETIAFGQTVAGFEALGAGGSPYYVATTRSDYADDGGAVAALFGAITVSVPTWSPSAATIRFVNGTAVPVYLAGIGLFGINAFVGSTVVSEARDATSIDTYGPQPLQLSLPQWVQTPGVAQSLAAALLGDVKDPHPQLSGLTIVGDPRRQLGDRVEIADPSGTQLDGEFWLTQVSDAVGKDGDYLQTISARAATTVMRWGVGHWGLETWG